MREQMGTRPRLRRDRRPARRCAAGSAASSNPLTPRVTVRRPRRPSAISDASLEASRTADRPAEETVSRLASGSARGTRSCATRRTSAACSRALCRASSCAPGPRLGGTVMADKHFPVCHVGRTPSEVAGGRPASATARGREVRRRRSCSTRTSSASPAESAFPRTRKLLGPGHPLFDARHRVGDPARPHAFAQGVTLVDPNILVPAGSGWCARRSRTAAARRKGVWPTSR